MPRGGLSTDPEKRQRQLAALAGGRRKQAEALLQSPGDPAPEPGQTPPPPRQPKPGQSADSPGIHAYADPEPEPVHETEPRPAEPAGDPEPERRRGGLLTGLRDGFADW